MRDNLAFFEEVLGLVSCFVYFIITLVIFIDERLCWEFTMFGLIIEPHVLRTGIVAAIGHHV